MSVIINGANRGRFERVDLSQELSGALSLVRDALEEGDAPFALDYLADALRIERVMRGELTGLWCADCSAPVIGEPACRCEACPACEAISCVCRFYAETVPVREAKRLDLLAVREEARRLAGLVV